MSSHHPQHALGIDFGTSNSYFSDVLMRGGTPSYTDLKFHNGQSSVPTCVLYRKEGEEWLPDCFGDAAIELWKDLTEEERGDYRFRGGFKPDLSFNEQSYRDSVAFFQSVRQYLEEQRILLHFSPEEGRQVVVGVPAENVPGQEEKTLAILREAGILDAVLLPEPEGALFYHLFYDSDRISVHMAHQGVLVVDFGGGTLDLAYLKDGDVHRHWGNPMLGGRLFDDLFFQWFLDTQKGDVRREMDLDDNLDFLRTFGFRRLKERFSTAWANGTLERFRERITMGVDFDYGVFRRPTLDEFWRRARNYSASPDLLRDLELLQEGAVDLLRAGSLDLPALIEKELRRFEKDSDPLELKAIILTGGSCRWPFMLELVREVFPDAELFQSADPEATISRGLGLSFGFREYAREVSRNLQTGLEELHTEVVELIGDGYKTFASRVSRAFTSKLYVEQIQPVFERWRDAGGTIEDLEREAESLGQNFFETEGQQILRDERERMEQRLREMVDDTVQRWLHRHNIIHTEFLNLDQISEEDAGKVRIRAQLGGVMDNFFAAMGLLLSGIMGMVIAAVAGGSGTALLMSGPVGWLLGLVIGIAGSALIFSSFNEKSIHIPSWLLKKAATDTRLDEAKRQFQVDLERKLLEEFDEKEELMQAELKSQVGLLVEHIATTMPVTAILRDNH